MDAGWPHKSDYEGSIPSPAISEAVSLIGKAAVIVTVNVV